MHALFSAIGAVENGRRETHRHFPPYGRKSMAKTNPVAVHDLDERVIPANEGAPPHLSGEVSDGPAIPNTPPSAGAVVIKDLDEQVIPARDGAPPHLSGEVSDEPATPNTPPSAEAVVIKDLDERVLSSPDGAPAHVSGWLTDD
jgi:hypothetical protein